MSRQTDMTERGLEALIVARLTGTPVPTPPGGFAETPAAFAGPDDYVQASPENYDRNRALDPIEIAAFLTHTQPDTAAALQAGQDTPVWRGFLDRVAQQLDVRGAVDVLRRGVKHGPHAIVLYAPLPSPGNPAAAKRFTTNRFAVTRQLAYAVGEGKTLDIGLFINGLPLATFEVKNRQTGQTVHDAVRQYREDRDARARLFRPARCAVHFALDEEEVRMCTQLQGAASEFLPFNRGWNDGAGNPPDPSGLKTAYLWREVLAKRSLAEIVEGFAGQFEMRDALGRVQKRPVFPRYHQLDVVRQLCGHAGVYGAGWRYLVQHSAGSGKSISIAWTVHKLVGLEHEGAPLFDTVVVVTDRQVLDKNLHDTIGGFEQTRRLMGHADDSAQLRDLIGQGKKVVVTTVQKFPVILDEIGTAHRGRRFAIVIDEAHSGQGGRATGALNTALGGVEEDAEADTEDRIAAIIEGRRMLDNASYFAFTATPKNKTLELFGERYEEGGEVRHRAHHLYSIKQAIEEGFILDVLQNYTPVPSWYRLAQQAGDDPDVDVSRTLAALRRYVEGHDHAIATKAGIMVDHFLDQVLARRKVGGKARAMVAVDGRERAVEYWRAINAALVQRGSPYRAIVAFSGTVPDAGEPRTEAAFNGFPSNELENLFATDPWRILVVADKYLTGFDQPLLFAMYVDKVLAGVKAVQALSRLNRARPGKTAPVVLDFRNDMEVIRLSFADYYRATILAGETDPNVLHDFKRRLDDSSVYSASDVEQAVALFLSAAPRDQLDPMLDAAAARYRTLDEDGQVAFKGGAKAFVRTYAFLAALLPYAVPDWERLSVFLSLLIPKLPSPANTELGPDVLDAIDMDSYRVEVNAALRIALPDEDAEIGPVPMGEGVSQPESVLDLLSAVVQEFNERFGAVEFRDDERLRKFMFEEIPRRVKANPRVLNAMRSGDTQNARIEHDRAVEAEVNDGLEDHTELYTQYRGEAAFRAWLQQTLFRMNSTSNPNPATREEA